MSNTAALSAYAARRDMWLTRVVADLRTNNRFAAAWLAGSFGRKTNDAVSDLDLHVVLSDDADALLHKPVQIWADTTPERRAVFKKFGTPVLVHENHWNAICNGTFTLLIYADLVMVDWQFIAVSQAIRPHFTQLLFAERAIPHAPAPLPEDAATRHANLVEQTGYFWLMAATACRYIVRHDTSATVAQLRMIHSFLDGLERLLRGAPCAGDPRNFSLLALTLGLLGLALFDQRLCRLFLFGLLGVSTFGHAHLDCPLVE